MKRLMAPLAVGMTALYLALAIGTAGCLFLHAERPGASHHQSSSHPAHSALCVWVCQANPTVAIVDDPPPSVILQLAVLLLLLSPSLTQRLLLSLSDSRAPPR